MNQRPVYMKLVGVRAATVLPRFRRDSAAILPRGARALERKKSAPKLYLKLFFFAPKNATAADDDDDNGAVGRRRCCFEHRCRTSDNDVHCTTRLLGARTERTRLATSATLGSAPAGSRADGLIAIRRGSQLLFESDTWLQRALFTTNRWCSSGSLRTEAIVYDPKCQPD